MDEMKDCIYRKEATEFINKCLEHEEELQSVERETLIAVKKHLESIPAADVRPVVSCCDCKHFQVNVSPSGYLPQGVPEWECRHWCGPTDPTDFCSYGEKWEEGKR